MSLTTVWTVSLSSLAEAPIGLVLAGKWTALLAMAWLANAALAGRNPRWRVALWRGVMLGVGLVAALAMVSPIVSVPIGSDASQALAERRPEIGEQPQLELAAPAVVAPATAPPRMVRRETVAPFTQTMRSPEPTAVHDPVASSPLHALRLGKSWLLAAWLAGVLLLTGRLILSGLALRRLLRRSREANAEIVRACRAIAARLGYTGTVRVAFSDDIASPCLAGVLRPVLLLPGREHPEAGDLRAILAHELAHARNHDLAWNLAAHLASIVLWFHPLAWRIRAAHAAACDGVSDALAADCLGDVVSYGRTLARLAVRARASGPGARAGDGANFGRPPPP